MYCCYLVDYLKNYLGFLAFINTRTATAPIIPPKIKSTCIGNPPVAVAVPVGPCGLTKAISALLMFLTCAKPDICICPLGGGLEDLMVTSEPSMFAVADASLAECVPSLKLLSPSEKTDTTLDPASSEYPEPAAEAWLPVGSKRKCHLSIDKPISS